MSGISIAIFLIFNLSIFIALAITCRSISLKDLLREKAAPIPEGTAQDNTSMSRLAGAIGAIVLSAFFWAIANVILMKTLSVPDQTAQVEDLVASVGSFFTVGASLFAPYAFNQLGQLFKVDK